ncbi:MAG TPA: alpha/beta fold hydrolase [Candidatus Saccharimonadales bacterium]|nr:alpha/beta fold hydrolase [Candidatus Saccharimonadales bacterium]
MSDETGEDSAYAALLAKVDQSDFGGALRSVFLADAMRRPLHFAKAGLELSAGQTAVAARAAQRAFGRGNAGPVAPSDNRFADRTWQANPAFRTLAESYLCTVQWAQHLVETSHAPALERNKARFALDLMLDALAPTNIPWANPAVWKEAFETGGQSLMAGASNFVDDLMHNGGRPRQVDATSFSVGKNLAATPGRVVMRNSLIELLMYEAQTDLVHAQPILCSPPWINKYYIMDLAPGRSFIEYAVQHGFTVFCISYRNPDASMRGVSWDDYLRLGLMAALDQVSELTGSPVVNIVGLCLGGTMSTIGLAHLAARGEAERVGWMTITNTLVDFSIPGNLGVFADRESVKRLEQNMRQRGYLEASAMAQTFDWLRGNDLVWSYVINNWYMGKTPPAFDLLAWNGDSTNMPATMHTQYLRACYVDNLLIRPGAFQIAGTPIDLGKIRQPMYVLGAEADHIAPWKGTYLTTQHVGGEVRYTLTSSGHVAGIVNPPGNPKAAFWTRPHADRGVDAQAWRDGAERVNGSWWDDWVDWAAARSGELVAPPRVPPGDPAPGSYARGEDARRFKARSPARRAQRAGSSSVAKSQ